MYLLGLLMDSKIKIFAIFTNNAQSGYSCANHNPIQELTPKQLYYGQSLVARFGTTVRIQCIICKDSAAHFWLLLSVRHYRHASIYYRATANKIATINIMLNTSWNMSFKTEQYYLCKDWFESHKIVLVCPILYPVSISSPPIQK